MARIDCPTAPAPNVYCSETKSNTAVANAPTKVSDEDDHPVREQLGGRYTPARPRHNDQVVPGEQLCARDDDEDQPKGEDEAGEQSHDAYGSSPPPALTVVAKMAPSAMNDPASTESTKTSNRAMAAFVEPTFSAFRATSAGGRASSPVGVNGASLTHGIVDAAPGRDG